MISRIHSCLPRISRVRAAFLKSSCAFSSSVSEPDKTAWQVVENHEIQTVTQKAIIHDLTQRQIKTIESTVPWFLNNMPSSYFRQVPWDIRMDHIKAISAVKDANMDLDMNLTSHLPDGRLLLTFIRPDTRAGRLLEMIKELPWNHWNDDYLPLTRLLVNSASDGSMSLNVFTFGNETSRLDDFEEAGERIIAYADAVQTGQYLTSERNPPPSDLFEKESLIEYMQKCSQTYVTQSDPRRFLKQRLMFELVSGSEDMAVDIEKPEYSSEELWIDIAVANSLPQFALEHACRLLFLEKFDVARAHLDVVSDGDNGNVTFLRLRVTPMDDIPDEESFSRLQRRLKRMKWLDPVTIDLVFDRHPWLGIDRGEIITGLASLMHPIMARLNAVVFSKANILETITKQRYIGHAASLAELFLDRFNPANPLCNEELQARSDEIRRLIDTDVEDSVAAELLLKMLDIIRYTLRTNIFLENRYSLGLRLDPAVMSASEDMREEPYGILFAHGRRFNGFQVRFRDIARGGLRLVTPHSNEQFALESARQYDECYGLAYAQQLKNKDIPEGGSKAVCLINVTGFSALGKNFIMRKSVKAFTDTILDLIVETKETEEHIVDFLGKKEIIYLGPDEQVIPSDINWVVARAAKRGYHIPSAFMSSKPRVGINHKEYGVTSEGVNVFLDVALRRGLAIDPTNESFTIKMTGGPDGDVAGNEIKILIREYGENARIVGLADHSGCAEDPEGLNHEELLRLVESNFSISHFNESMLSPRGKLYLVDTEEGIKMRNNMHNRVKADAFIPAGGRPNTIDIHNYKNFLSENGTPSSRLIVEAANIFITPEAREKLFDDAGVLIVKDSSANKCGVICSSFEICAAMMLSEVEFYDNKKAIVDEVLTKLRNLAKMEAELLFREFDNYPGTLMDFSQVISDTINKTKDSLMTALDSISDDDKDSLMLLFRSHLPKTLADLAFDRVQERLPEQYVRNAISSCLASKLVYKEGTKFVESLSKESLAQTALTYLQKEKEVATLKQALQEANMPKKEKEIILRLLDAGGTRTALSMSRLF